MKQGKKVLAVALAMATWMSLLVGCGKQEADKTPAQTIEETTETQEAAGLLASKSSQSMSRHGRKEDT